MRTMASRIAADTNAIRPLLFIFGKEHVTDWLAFYLDCHRMKRGRVLHVDVLWLRVRQIHRDVDRAWASEGNQLSRRSVSFTVKQDGRVRGRIADNPDKDEFHQEFLQGERIGGIASAKRGRRKSDPERRAAGPHGAAAQSLSDVGRSNLQTSACCR